MITHHTQLLNALIEKYNLKSYLEIGVQNPANNFDKIKCEWKVGVDPDLISSTSLIDNGVNSGYNTYKPSSVICGKKSDEYFDLMSEDVTNIFDLIFIDGLHHADQVQRDFENSLRCLSDNGFIVIHDVLPENEAGTIVPRITKQWWGDVYKWAMSIGDYLNINFKTFDIDNGCMVVWKEPGFTGTGKGMFETYDWESYQRIGRSLMNVTSTVEI